MTSATTDTFGHAAVAATSVVVGRSPPSSFIAWPAEAPDVVRVAAAAFPAAARAAAARAVAATPASPTATASAAATFVNASAAASSAASAAAAEVYSLALFNGC